MLTLKGCLRAVAALLFGCCLGVPTTAGAMMGASVSAPLRHDIDAQCAPLDRAAEASKLIYDINVKTFKDEDATGTFAHVLARGGKIVAVYLYSTEMQTRGEIITRDCYLAGHLARMRSEYHLQSGSLWTRTKYYGDDGSFMQQTDEHHPTLAGSDMPVGPAPKDEPVYRTPGALPFYKAYSTGRKH